MEGGLSMLNSLLHSTLRNLCSPSDSAAKWVYAVFWRILPRNFPPPKWDHGGLLDRDKTNRRNWILVWEDGFCDFHECEVAGRGHVKGKFGADIFFKMSHEVYNFGEGLVGKVAADNSHKWVYRDSPNESNHNLSSSWNVSIDPQPRAWEAQFNSGIETIAIVSVREGIIQLGSLDKVAEDLNLVISIQRKFSYLHSIPGIYPIHRPHSPFQHPYKPQNPHLHGQTNRTPNGVDVTRQILGFKRNYYNQGDPGPIKSINLGYNSPQNGVTGGLPLWSFPSLLPSMSGNIGALLSKTPPVMPSYCSHDTNFSSLLSTHNSKIQNTQDFGPSECVNQAAQESKQFPFNNAVRLEDRGTALGFEPPGEGYSASNTS